MLLEVAPAETIYSQINQVGQQYAAEARRLVLLACGSDDFAGDIGKQEVTTSLSRQRVAAAAAAEHIRGASRNVGLQIQRSPHPASDLPRTTPSPPIQRALAVEIQPFLMTGTSTSKLLGSRARNAWFFEDLRLRVAPELRTLVGQLEELCERRRQLNVQRIMHFWLHNWLWVHLPLSIALLALLLAHVVLAFRFG